MAKSFELLSHKISEPNFQLTFEYDHSLRLKYFSQTSSCTPSPLQGILVPKLTLGPFLTLIVRNGPNLQNDLFQEYISLNPSRVEQNYTIYLLKKG